LEWLGGAHDVESSQGANVSDIWYMLGNADRYLYHYTGAHTLTQRILPDQTLRLSPFQRLNDPRETKDFRLSGADWGDDMSPAVLDDLAIRLKREWRVACFVSDPTEAVFSDKERLGADQLQAMHERGHSRPRMWAQYAESHTGACLVFDKQALAKTFADVARQTGLKAFSGLVHYQNTPVVPRLSIGPFTVSLNDVRRHGPIEAARRHGERFWRELFLTKNRDWEAEREFRWLLNGEYEGELYVRFAGCLNGLLLGPRFPEGLKSEVGRHADVLGIEVAIMEWNNGIPQIMPSLPRLLQDQADKHPFADRLARCARQWFGLKRG